MIWTITRPTSACNWVHLKEDVKPTNVLKHLCSALQYCMMLLTLLSGWAGHLREWTVLLIGKYTTMVACWDLTRLWTGCANSFTLPLLPSSLPASWPSSCGFLAYPFRLIHFCNATYKHLIFQKSSQCWGHNISRSLKYRVTPYTAGVWEDSPRACSGRIVAAQLEVWFGSQQPLQMEHTIRHLEIYSAHSWRLLM